MNFEDLVEAVENGTLAELETQPIKKIPKRKPVEFTIPEISKEDVENYLEQGLTVVEIMDEINLRFDFLHGDKFVSEVTRAVYDQRIETCDRHRGYIHKILKINRIYQARLPPGSLVAKIQVSYSAMTINPVIGQPIKAKVCDITPFGVYLNNEKISCLITTQSMSDLKINLENKEILKGKQKITLGDIVKCKVLNIRYKKVQNIDEIQCIVDFF